jgi:hypothetical protein
MDKAHSIQHVFFSGMTMHLRVDGRDYQTDIANESERLRNATQKQRESFELSPAGYGIHWPDGDSGSEGLALTGFARAAELLSSAITNRTILRPTT